MKKILYSVALLAATMIGFTSCEEDEEELIEEMVGEYKCGFSYLFSKDGLNYNVPTDSIHTSKEWPVGLSSVDVSKQGDDAIKIYLSSYGNVECSSFVKRGEVEGYSGYTGIGFNVNNANFLGANCIAKRKYDNVDCEYNVYLKETSISLIANVADVNGFENITDYSKVLITISLEKK